MFHFFPFITSLWRIYLLPKTFVLGLISAQDQGRCPIQSWTPNKSYEFEYHGRLLTGLPSLASHYSGVGMRATVKVLVKDTNILVLKVEAPKYVDVNQVLHPKERGADTSYKVDGWNWRNLYLPPLKDVSYKYKCYISNVTSRNQKLWSNVST